MGRLSFSLVTSFYIIVTRSCPISEQVISLSIFETTLSMNSTTDIVGWASEPRGRGTVGLLWSCFATMFLCTWNAIHPNLPGLGASKSMTFLRRVGLLLLCLVAPEVFAINAFRRFVDAELMRTKVRSS
jgi:hypothetical protein